MSSASEASTCNQQDEKKGKDKNKDFSILVDERLAEINNSMATLTRRVDDMDKHIEESSSWETLIGFQGRYKRRGTP